MNFTESTIKGLFEIDLERIEDNRGFFARSFCANEFKEMSLCDTFVQSNVSFNKEAGTLRGMHYQTSPFDEVKLVSCKQGSIFDVAVDLREGSPTYLHWYGCELNETNCKSLYIPSGCAHGYQTLKPNSSVSYMVSNFYSPSHERGIRFDDPLVNIIWPLPISGLSNKDRDREA
jgi:dTDP-4-dehydrorhamnose 3,5-epimerase